MFSVRLSSTEYNKEKSIDWFYNDSPLLEIPDGYVGFVYLITNLTNRRMYVGKKLAVTTVKLPPLKGQKRKRKVVKETDWRKYWGSSAALLKDVSELGEENFRREILYFCETKSEMAYLETEEQFKRKVLHTDEYYNGIIHCRINRPK